MSLSKQEQPHLVLIGERYVPVWGGGEYARLAIQSVPFREWVDRLDPEFLVWGIELQSIDVMGKPGEERVLFVKFKASVEDLLGNPLPGIVFMRGGSVAALCVLRSEGEDYFLLTEQPRIASGRFRFREIPAGMLDGNGHFAGVAAKEIAEETGILLTEEHLIDLTALFYPEDRRVYFSVGGSDEFIRVFLYQQEVTREELEVLRGRLTGAKGENEHITLRVERLRDAIGLVQDMKFLSALTLYREARARGLIEEL